MLLDGTRPAPASVVENPTHRDYAKAARSALGSREFPLAIQQVSAAIALAPLETEYHRLLDAIVDKAKGPLRLVALPSDGAFFGLCAARARVLARLGRYAEATEHVLAAATFSPSTPFVVWARGWLQTRKNARKVPSSALAANLVVLLGALEPPLDEGVRANLDAALDCCRYVEATETGGATLTVVMTRILRRLGRTQDALELLAEREREVGACWELAIAKAAVLSDIGDHTRRRAVLEQATALREAEPSTFFDLGDAHLCAGDPVRASTAYENGLARLTPEQDCAPEIRSRVALLAHDRAVYQEVIGKPIDPIIGVIRSIEAGRPSGVLKIRVRADRPCAPSAKLAFEHTLSARGLRGDLTVLHHGGAAQLGPPWLGSPTAGAAVLDVVATVAAVPFSWGAWRERTKESATSNADELIAAMAQVPRPPEGTDAVQWVHRWQIAAAMLAAEAANGEQALAAAIDGVDDWSAAAAVLGWRVIAEDSPDRKSAIVAALSKLLPAPAAPLPPLSWTLAVVGAELSEGEMRERFMSLRARVLLMLEETLDLDASREPF